MVEAYSALNQTHKALVFQEHLLNCNELPIEQSLPLLESFLAQNSTARAFNLLTLYNMYEQAPPMLRDQAKTLLRNYGLRVIVGNRNKIVKVVKKDDFISTQSIIEAETNNEKDSTSASSFNNSSGNMTNVYSTDNENSAATLSTEISAANVGDDDNLIMNDFVPINNHDTANSIIVANDSIVSSQQQLGVTEDGLELSVQPTELNETKSQNQTRDMGDLLSDNSTVGASEASSTTLPTDSFITENSSSSVALSDLDSTESESNTSSLASIPIINETSIPAESLPSSSIPPAQNTKTDGAISRKEKQLEQQLRAARSYVNMAATYLQREEIAMALKQVNLALKKAPNLEDALFVRGQIYLHQEEYLKAIPDLLTVYAESPLTRGNATAGALLCQLARYLQQHQHLETAIHLYRVLSSMETTAAASTIPLSSDGISDPMPYICMKDLQYVHFADALASMHNYSAAIDILDQLHPQNTTLVISTMIEERYLQWLEHTGNTSRVELYFENAFQQGDISLTEFANMYLRRNNTAKVLSLYTSEREKWQLEVVRLHAEMDAIQAKYRHLLVAVNIEQNVTSFADEDPHLFHDESELRHLQQQLKTTERALHNAELSLGEVLKHLGEVYHLYLQDLTEAQQLYQQAMALGVYDREVRKFFASIRPQHMSSEPHFIDNESSSDNTSETSNMDGTAIAGTPMPTTPQKDTDADLFFPHRHHQTPLFFPNHRWIVYRLADLPYFTLQQLREQTSAAAHRQFSDTMSIAGTGHSGLAALLEQMEYQQQQQEEESKYSSHSQTESDDEDDVIHATDSPFEQERKRKLQEQKAFLKQEELERQHRRDEALMGGFGR